MDPLNQPNSFNGMDAYINAVNTENKHIAITDPNAVSYRITNLTPYRYYRIAVAAAKRRL